jgi:hypothetical protein
MIMHLSHHKACHILGLDTQDIRHTEFIHQLPHGFPKTQLEIKNLIFTGIMLLDQVSPTSFLSGNARK